MDIREVGEKPDSSVLEKLNTTITLDEIKKAIQSLKSKKAPGMDGITNKMIKSFGKSLMKNIKSFLTKYLTYSKFKFFNM